MNYVLKHNWKRACIGESSANEEEYLSSIRQIAKTFTHQKLTKYELKVIFFGKFDISIIHQSLKDPKCREILVNTPSQI